MPDITIREAADELNVSKTAVRKWLHNLPEDSYRKDDSGRGMVWITPGGMELLRERIGNQTANRSETDRKPIANQSETDRKPIANQSETDRKPIANQPQTVCDKPETDRKQPQTNRAQSQTEPQTIGNQSETTANQSLQSEPETAPLLPHFRTTDITAEMVQILREQLASKDTQIADLAHQNAALIAQNAELLATVQNLSERLGAAQALHAASVKQLQEAQTATNYARDGEPEPVVVEQQTQPERANGDADRHDATHTGETTAGTQETETKTAAGMVPESNSHAAIPTNHAHTKQPDQHRSQTSATHTTPSMRKKKQPSLLERLLKLR